jgi:hypothetical protein
MDLERRRSPRCWTKLWLAIDGVDAELRPRIGDISATGIFFEYDRFVGEAGTVQWLYLSSADRIVSLQIMASVVRSAIPAGVAFEFMPESDEAVAQLRDFLHYVFALAADHVLAHDARAAAKSAGIRSIVLDCAWDLPVGAPLRVALIARDVARTTRVEGRVVRNTSVVNDGEALYRLEVAVQRELEGPIRRFSAQSMAAVTLKERVEGPTRRFTPARGIPFAKDASSDDARRESDQREHDASVNDALEGLLGTLLALRSHPRAELRGHLAGELERIRLPTLLSLFDMDKMTGELSIERDGALACTIYCREGRIVDLVPAAPDRPKRPVREELTRILAWDSGGFSFTLTPVERADRVGMSTMALLLDLAREGRRSGTNLTLLEPRGTLPAP